MVQQYPIDQQVYWPGNDQGFYTDHDMRGTEYQFTDRGDDALYDPEEEKAANTGYYDNMLTGKGILGTGVGPNWMTQAAAVDHANKPGTAATMGIPYGNAIDFIGDLVGGRATPESAARQGASHLGVPGSIYNSLTGQQSPAAEAANEWGSFVDADKANGWTNPDAWVDPDGPHYGVDPMAGGGASTLMSGSVAPITGGDTSAFKAPNANPLAAMFNASTADFNRNADIMNPDGSYGRQEAGKVYGAPFNKGSVGYGVNNMIGASQNPSPYAIDPAANQLNNIQYNAWQPGSTFAPGGFLGPGGWLENAAGGGNWWGEGTPFGNGMANATGGRQYGGTGDPTYDFNQAGGTYNANHYDFQGAPLGPEGSVYPSDDPRSVDNYHGDGRGLSGLLGAGPVGPDVWGGDMSAASWKGVGIGGGGGETWGGYENDDMSGWSDVDGDSGIV